MAGPILLKQLMTARRAWRLAFILGLLSLLAGIIFGVLYVDAELKHSNIASHPVWVDPPMTDSDIFFLHFPVRWLLFVGIVLLAATALRRLLIGAARYGRRKSGENTNQSTS